MALQVWLPLNGDLHNQGLKKVTITSNGVTVDNNGKIGKCYSFDGTDDRILIENFDIGNVWSYGCWVYSPISSRGWEGIIILNNNGGDADMQLGFYTYPTGNRIQSTANGQYNSSISFTYGQWNHLFATFDGINLKTYINGVLVNTKEITNTLLSRTNLAIGARYKGSNTYDCYFNGKINDVRIYDNVLSAKEIKKLSQALVLHYPLNNVGVEEANILPNSNDLTLWSKESGVSVVWDSTVNMYKISDASHTSSRWGIYQNLTLQPNTYYEFSVDGLKADQGGGFGFIEGTGSWPTNGTFTTTKTRYTARIKVGNAAATARVYLYVNPVSGGTNYTYVSAPKLQKGNFICSDISGYNHNGEVIQSVDQYNNISPKYNNCSHFSTTNQKIKVTGLSTSGFGNSYSISWIAKASNFSSSPMMWGFADGIRLNGIHSGIYWNTGDGSNNPLYQPGTTTAPAYPTGGVWHYFVMVGDGTSCLVYLDGILWAQAKTYKAISGTTIYINGWDSSTSYCFSDLLVSDFRIYATALSADDIKELYRTSKIVSGTTVSPRSLE